MNEQDSYDMKNKGVAGRTIGIILVLILLILGWGFIGGQEADKVGVTCEMGITDSLCWFWSKNTAGEIQEGLDNVGNAVSDFFN